MNKTLYNKDNENEKNNENIEKNKTKYNEKINDIILDDDDINKINKKDKEKNKENESENKKEKEYISPYPVPGYSNNENLWEEIGDISIKKKSYTGLRYMLSRKESKTVN